MTTTANYSRRIAAAVTLAGGLVLAACNDGVVPNFNAPTSIAATPGGMQNLMTGILNTTRDDVNNYITFMYGFARDATQFQGTESAFDTELLGQVPISNSDFIGTSVWDFEFRNAKALNQFAATVPSVSPAYTPEQIGALTGVAQTLKALQFMWIAETHDTLGVPVYGITAPASSPAPILCNKDVWQYIVALLDSGQAQLNIGGGTAIPLTLPPGFNAVSSTASTFLAFNRALAGKAGLELAYAISRPIDSTVVGVTDPTAQAALVRADSAILASALYNPGALIPGGVGEPNAVYLDFSTSSGDQGNPIAATNTTQFMLTNFGNVDYDPTDLRVQAKFSPNSLSNVGQATYDTVVFKPAAFSGNGLNYTAYSGLNSSIPIIRNEELVLLRAQIHIAQQDWPTAVTLLNDVRVTVGGEAPYAGSLTGYIPVREALLHEQRLSTTYEMGGDREWSIRMYALTASRFNDAPPFSVDLHPSVLPIPSSEQSSRNGNLTPVCN